MTAVQEGEDFCQFRFDYGDEPSDTITVEYLESLCEKPELGEISFQVFRQFLGNSIIDGKI